MNKKSWAKTIGIWIYIILFVRCQGINLKPFDPVLEQIPSLQLTVSLAPGSRGNFSLSPKRAYVTRNGKNQQAPRLILKVSGIGAYTKIYWSYHYQSGPHNPRKTLQQSHFSPVNGHHFNHWDNSTRANPLGESEVFFTTTTYAGDRFQFGIHIREYSVGFKNESDMSIQFRNSIFKTGPTEVWKQIHLESPKVLKNVKFPEETWKLVRENLEKIHIELKGIFNSRVLDPVDPSISYYFFTREDDNLRGKGRDPRYGPAGFGPLEIMLSRLTIIFSDQKPSTINTFVLGCTSPKSDLIHDSSLLDFTPKPLDYCHSYKAKEINLRELLSLGTGSAMPGKSPAIFIWSDFWFLSSKLLHVAHEKSLARVILHELGHHLLMFKIGGDEGILDAGGHPISGIMTGQCIMSGSSIIQFDRKRNPFISSNAKRMERRFIDHPVWNPKIEMLIRRDYIPADE